MIFLVGIKDKDLLGEPIIAFAAVEAVDENAAFRAGLPDSDRLIDAGRGRCHRSCSARPLN